MRSGRLTEARAAFENAVRIGGKRRRALSESDHEAMRMRDLFFEMHGELIKANYNAKPADLLDQIENKYPGSTKSLRSNTRFHANPDAEAWKKGSEELAIWYSAMSEAGEKTIVRAITFSGDYIEMPKGAVAVFPKG